MALTASASEGDGSGGGGGIFGNVGKLVARVMSEQDQTATSEEAPGNSRNMKKGGKVSASSRADGIAQRGKTRGRLV